MTEASSEFRVSAILMQEGEWWSAHCLEYDIATQAKSLSDLRYELMRVLYAHVVVSAENKQPPFHNLKPAPKKFWTMFANSKLRLEADELPFRLPPNVEFPRIVPRMRIAEPIPVDAQLVPADAE
jgi:hypothetical protein